MLLALAALAAVPDWIPARWNSAAPATVELVAPTPINCLLVEQRHWSAEFSRRAGERGIVTLGVVYPGERLEELAARAKAAGLAGIVFEGAFEEARAAAVRSTLRDSQLVAIDLGPRTRMRFDSGEPVVGTHQGVWPGINATDDGSAKAAPSGAPWIDTNSGFLRFARAMTRGEIWIGHRPPRDRVMPVARYLQAVADAAMVGARWVVALDGDFDRRLLEGDAGARKDFERIAGLLRFFGDHKDWRRFDPHGQLALVQDISSGGLISGGILDMISVKHTPVRPVPGRHLDDERMAGSRMAVNVDPAALDASRVEVLRRFTRGGGTLLTAPPGWKFPAQRADQITLDKEDIETLDAIWKEVNSMTGRRNLGARLFNVSSMLSNLVAPASGRPLVLYLVNYSDYAVENVTVHLLGRYGKARLFEPGSAPRVIPVYENEEGTGADIDKITSVAALVLE